MLDKLTVPVFPVLKTGIASRKMTREWLHVMLICFSLVTLSRKSLCMHASS